ncbi:MAG: hypothetical protein HKN62_06020 [Phycisphaerales bacterium]|nr:hypothetical protein [Phycisphaerales bacterium]
MNQRLTLAATICGALAAGSTGVQADLSVQDWQDDLRFLQETVHTEYPFLFKKTTAADFDAAVEELHAAIPTLAPHEVVAGLARIVSSFEYGHTLLRAWNSEWVRHALPVNFYHFSDGLYVEGADEAYASAVGSRVIAIEGMPVDRALAAIRPVVPAENDQFFKAHGVGTLRIIEYLHAQGVLSELKHDVTLTLERDGVPFDLTVTAVAGVEFGARHGFTRPGSGWVSARDQSATPLYLKHPDRVYFFEHLPEHKTVYVRHSQIRDDATEDIPTFYARLFDFIETNDVERLVLDVRLNGGGNNYKNKPIVTGLVRCEKINQPGKLFVIIGRRTFSACQNLVNEIDNYTNAIFVGEPTSENINFYGDNRRVVLPNCGLPVFLSFAWWQDKPQWENGPWTAPHLAVEMSFDEYRTNGDPVLDAALAFEGEFIRDPNAHLTALFKAGRLEELEAEAERMVADPMYRFFDFEAAANQVGYQLMNDQMIDQAIWLLRLNTRLFPESANAWDSLAEAHWKGGQMERAVELYNKAISMDPEGPVGDNARTMLQRMRREAEIGG